MTERPLIFLSHAGSDKPRLAHLVTYLLDAGYRLFIDHPEKIPGFTRDVVAERGIETLWSSDKDKWSERLEEALDRSDCVLVIVSDALIAGRVDAENKERKLERRIEWNDEIIFAQRTGKIALAKIGKFDPSLLPSPFADMDAQDISAESDPATLAWNLEILAKGRIPEAIEAGHRLREKESLSSRRYEDPTTPGSESVSSGTQSSNPAVLVVSLVKRVWTFLGSLSERAARATAPDETPKPTGPPLKMPGRRALLALSVAFALVLLALHAMAWMALGDLVEAAAKPQAQASDLLVQELRPTVVRGDGRIASVFGPDGRVASVRSGGSPSQLALPTAATLLVAEEDGRVAMTRIGARTTIERALDSIGGHWRAHVWSPVSGFAGNRILPLLLQVDPLSGPASARPRRVGVYRPCRDCPEMVELGAGMDVLGPMLWQRSEGANWRSAVSTPGFRIALAPVTSAQWAACKCPQVVKKRDGTILINHPRDASRYLLWLAAMTGRTFRIPTSEEWELAARASARFGSARQWGNGIGEWVCVPIVSGKSPICDYARRGASGAVYDVAPASRARAALRLVEDIGLATPGRATPVGAASYEQAEQLRQRLVQEATGEQAPAQPPPVQQVQRRQRPVQRRAQQAPAQQPAQRPAQQTPPEQNLAY